MTGPNFSILPAAAAEDAAVSAPAYRLLGLLAAHADKSGYCFPSVGRLAKKMRTSERWVQKLLFALSATPYLNVTKRPGRSTVYQIVTKGVNQEFTPEPVVHPRTSSSPGGEPVVRKGVNQEFTHNDTKNDKLNDTNKGDEFFRRFWAAYPNRTPNPHPKKPARNVFLAVLKNGADPEAIIRGAENYAAYIRQEGKEPRWIAGATKFLNQEYWTGYQTRPKPVFKAVL